MTIPIILYSSILLIAQDVHTTFDGIEFYGNGEANPVAAWFTDRKMYLELFAVATAVHTSAFFLAQSIHPALAIAYNAVVTLAEMAAISMWQYFDVNAHEGIRAYFFVYTF